MKWPHRTPAQWSICRNACALIAGLALAVAHAARPSYEAAVEFGRTLLAEYPKQGGRWLTARLDGDALYRTTFEPLGTEALESASLRDLWKATLLPAVHNEFKVLDTLPVVLAPRVQLLNGKRALECTFTSDTGHFQVLILRLDAKPNGEIVITDFHRVGPALEMSRRMRHLFLMLGVSRAPGLDDEERALSWASEGIQSRVNESLRLLGSGQPDQAFNTWERLPEEVRASRIWQELRDSMALAGSARAKASMQKAYQQGKLANGLLRLECARAAKDQAAVLAAWDAMLADSHQPPFLQAVKAGELLDGGRMAEALAMARNTYARYPISGTAYVIALNAACKLGSTPEAVDVLRDWGVVLPRKAIDDILKVEARFAGLLKSDAYRKWLAEPEPATADPVKA